MSRKLFKVLILGAMVVSALASASSASASWTITPSSGTFSATAGASKLAITGASAGINCTGATASGTILRGTGGWGIDQAASLTLAFTGCRAGGFAANVTCAANSVGLLPQSISGNVVTGDVIERSSPICNVRVPSIPTCTVDVIANGGIGTVAVRSATYDNSTGVLTVPTGTQTLTASWTTCGTLFGAATSSGTAVFSDGSGNPLRYSVAATWPRIT